MDLTVKTNPYTNSTSKQRWSFSKSKRFSGSSSHCDVSFYDTPSSLDKKAVSFGVGKRPSIIDRNKTNLDPGSYTISSCFDKPMKGCSFGTGRDETKFQNYMHMLQKSQTCKVYDVKNNDRGRVVSMCHRTQYPPNYFLPNDPESERRSKQPGPSTYQTIDSIGEKCVSSRHKNLSYKFLNGRRFSNKSTLEVGPGAYDDRTIKADGQYVLSTMRSSGKRTIFKGKKTSIFGNSDSKPGPGNYDVIGDFGICAKVEKGTAEPRKLLIKRPQTARQ